MKPAPFDYLRPGSLAEARRPWRRTRTPRCWPAGRAWCRCCRCGWRRPACSSTSTGCPSSPASRSTDDGVRVGALARHADVAGLRRRTPGAAAGVAGAAPRGAPDDPQPGHDRRVDRARRRGRRDAGGALAARRLRRRSRPVPERARSPAAELFVGPLETSLHHDEIAVSAFFPALADGAGVAFDEVARRHGDYALCGVGGDGRARRGWRHRRGPGRLPLGRRRPDRGRPDRRRSRGGWTTRRSRTAGELALGALDPADDIHATAATARSWCAC